MFKVGQKVVCVSYSTDGIDPRCFNSPRPIVNEIYTINYIRGDWIGFIELMQDEEFESKNFRPIDYTFGEKLAEEIQEEINQEQLVNA